MVLLPVTFDTISHDIFLDGLRGLGLGTQCCGNFPSFEVISVNVVEAERLDPVPGFAQILRKLDKF